MIATAATASGTHTVRAITPADLTPLRCCVPSSSVRASGMLSRAFAPLVSSRRQKKVKKPGKRGSDQIGGLRDRRTRESWRQGRHARVKYWASGWSRERRRERERRSSLRGRHLGTGRRAGAGAGGGEREWARLSRPSSAAGHAASTRTRWVRVRTHVCGCARAWCVCLHPQRGRRASRVDKRAPVGADTLHTDLCAHRSLCKAVIACADCCTALHWHRCTG